MCARSAYRVACILVFLKGWAIAAGTAPQLSLTQAVETALSRRPAIKAAVERIKGSDGLRLQARLRPNPTLSFQSENWRAWGNPSFDLNRDPDVFVFGSQTFEASGKRRRRIELAEHDTKIAELEKQALEWNIRQDVIRAYLQALWGQKQFELLDQSCQYLAQVVEYHKARVEQGSMAEADLIRVQLERERALISRDAAGIEAEQQRVHLLRAMGLARAATDFRLQEVHPQKDALAKLDLSLLLGQARTNRVSLRLAQAAIDRARTRVELERVQARPDWSVSAGYKRTQGFDTLLAGLSVPLPLLNHNEGNVMASERDVQSAQALLEESEADVSAEIGAAVTGIRRRTEMLAEMKAGIIRHAEESLNIALASYQEGGADLLRLLDAQRVQNEAQLLFARTEMEYIISIAELEMAVGTLDFLTPKEATSAIP